MKQTGSIGAEELLSLAGDVEKMIEEKNLQFKKEVTMIEDKNKEEMKNMMSNFFVTKTNGEISELKENIFTLNQECVKLYEKFQQEKYVF